MRLALLGYPISHSLSPSVYRRLLGDELESYDLLEIPNASDVPSLSQLEKQLDGLSITAPYKKHYLKDVIVESDLVREIGSINTIALRDGKWFATNTDMLATEMILKRFQQKFPLIQLILLGNGSMATMTKLIAKKLSLSVIQRHRGEGCDLSSLDLSEYFKPDCQTIVINSCSRSFVFKGMLHSSFIFWDYNYNFPSHSKSIPALVTTYYDGQEMLELQAQSALEFWRGKKA